MNRDNVNCEFCEEFESGKALFFDPPRCRELLRLNDFVVLPSVGAFIEGYLLLLPLDHYQSFAEIPNDSLGKGVELLTAVMEVVREQYGGCVVFEHGAHGRNPGGTCIDHAHIHIVGCSVDLSDKLSALGKVCSLREWQDYWRLRGDSYMLFAINNKITFVRDPEVPSQYLRKLLAARLKIPDLWDWATYLGLKEIAGTEATLRGSLDALDQQHD